MALSFLDKVFLGAESLVGNPLADAFGLPTFTEMIRERELSEQRRKELEKQRKERQKVFAQLTGAKIVSSMSLLDIVNSPVHNARRAGVR